MYIVPSYLPISCPVLLPIDICPWNTSPYWCFPVTLATLFRAIGSSLCLYFLLPTPPPFIYFSMWNFILFLRFFIFIILSHPLSFHPVAPSLFLLTSATALYRFTHSDSSASPFPMSGSSFPCLVYSSALKPEVACSFKMLEHDYQTARRHILEGSFIVTIMRTSLLPQLWVTYGVEVHGACG